jgi:hypothetical protein
MGAMRLGFVVAVLLAWSATAWGGRHEAGPLARARKELDALQYDKARASLDEALRAGDNGPAELAEIYLLAGQVAGALDDAAAAEDHFKRLLVLQPGAKLPAGMSPKITAPFDAARGWLDEHAALAADLDTRADALIFVIQSDPLAMIAEARVAVTVGGDEQPALSGRGNAKQITITLPEGELTLRASLVDANGNRLIDFPERELTVGVVTPISGPPVTDKPRAERPLYAKWWLWGGVAVAFAGGGTYFGLDALSAQDELDKLNADSMNHDFSEAQVVQERGERSALLANIGFGLAGAAAVVAAVLLVTDHRGGPARIEKSGAAITPTTDGGGATVVVFGRF